MPLTEEEKKKYYNRFTETPGGVRIIKWVPEKPGTEPPNFKDEEKYYDRFSDSFAEPEEVYDPSKDKNRKKKKGKPSFP
jgi:hypothetical protein